MSYKVIHKFTDLQDFNHLYNVGDEFPRIGMNVSQARLDELASSKNKQRKPLIKKIDTNPTVETDKDEYTKTDINRMPISELRELASKNGVDDVENIGGADLKKILIDKFEL